MASSHHRKSSLRCPPVIAVEVSLLEEDEVVLVHHLLAQDHRQELVVGDLLRDGRHDVPRLLRAGRVTSA